MEDFTSAAVSARRAELRKIAGRRRSRRADRVAEHRAPKSAKATATAVRPANPLCHTSTELTFACTR
jgi:hypothetical protein